MRYPFALLVLIASVGACQKKDQKRVDAPSYANCLAQDMLFNGEQCIEGNGVKNGEHRFNLLGDAPFYESLRKNTLRICHVHESLPDEAVQAQQDATRKALFTWFAEFQDLAPSLPKEIVFHSHAVDKLDPVDPIASCSNYDDLTILAQKDEVREHAEFISKWIWIHQSSTYPTILHEIGHILGLGDTYVETTGDCREHFPNSIMCQGEWERPMPVDRTAVRRIFCLMTDGDSSACFNHEKNSLLSFLPARVVSFGWGRKPYVQCNTTDKSLALRAYDVSISDQGASVYYSFESTDEQSVRESFGPEQYEVLLNLQRFENKDPQSIGAGSLLITRDKVTFKDPTPGLAPVEAPISSCEFDGRFLEFVNSRTGLNLRNRPLLPTDVLNLKASVVWKKSAAVTSKINFDGLIDLNRSSATIFRGYAADNSLKYMASMAFEEIGDFSPKLDSTELDLHFRALNLAAGKYTVHISTSSVMIELQLEVQD